MNLALFLVLLFMRTINASKSSNEDDVVITEIDDEIQILDRNKREDSKILKPYIDNLKDVKFTKIPYYLV